MAKFLPRRGRLGCIGSSGPGDAFYEVKVSPWGVHIEIGTKPGSADIVELVFATEDAYEFGSNVLRGYDTLAGL